ncbi:MAG: methyltransferase, TIGR04325 family [Proteobacteria bacterium]|nr:methyltransferase, TIGR04325 family [Pseudomonadota bacterium]
MIKYLLPYGIVELYRRYKNKDRISNFEGIFKNFEDTKTIPGADFITDQGIIWALNKGKKQFKNSQFEVLATDLARLSVLLNLLTKDRIVEVYDVGGGAGHTYFNIYHHVRNKKRLYWKLFEQSQLVTKFSKFIVSSKLPNISVDAIENLCINEEDEGNKLSILHMRSAMHYFEKPYYFLRTFMQNFDYIFLSRLPASNEIPEFVVKQKAYSTACPCWFFNLNKMAKFFEENNYKIIEIWNETEKFDMKNFPARYRLDHCRGILCKKIFIR